MRTAWLATLALCCALPVAADSPIWLDGVPDYQWYNGCSPTAGATLLGYYDRQDEYANLFEGTCPLTATHSDGVVETIFEYIASSEHVSGSYASNECTHAGAPNSMACFMHTDPDTGGSHAWNVATGLRRMAAWDDPATGLNESYAFHSLFHPVGRGSWSDVLNAGAFTFNDLRREIEEGRPVLLNVSLAHGAGHSVLAYGWWEDEKGNQWYSVRDTWQNGVGSTEEHYGIEAMMRDGQEWWRWEQATAGQSLGDGYFVDNAIYFEPDTDGLRVEESDFGDTVDMAELIDNDMETIYATLESEGDQDWYRIWLDKGKRFIAMTQDNEGYALSVDTYLKLYDPSGNLRMASNNPFGSTLTSALWWEVDQSGYWDLAVAYGGQGDIGEYWLATKYSHTPEPATMAMLALGIAAIVARRRRAA